MRAAAVAVLLVASAFGQDNPPFQGDPPSNLEGRAVLPEPYRIPHHPIDWKQDVETWWEKHPFNPKSPKPYKWDLKSPLPRIDVGKIRKKYPKSTTGGIEEALRLLPPSGGTLWFPKEGGPYEITQPEQPATNIGYHAAAILIHRRSNIHFVSDGAVIRCPHTFFNISSMEFTDRRRADFPIRNYYFKNIVFDGAGTAGIAFKISHTWDVLWDGCTFTNFKSPQRSHPAVISAFIKSDNLWVRNCSFDSGMNGVYWDGTRGSGVIGCTFTDGLTHSAVLFLTNDDMVLLSPPGDQRTAQYNIIAGNTYTGSQYRGYAFLTMAGANCLVAENRILGPRLSLVLSNGKYSFDPNLLYRYYGNRIVRNRLEKVSLILQVECWYDGPGKTYAIGGHVVRENTATDLDYILFLNPLHPGAKVKDVEAFNNVLSGPRLPRVKIGRDGVSGVKVHDNVLSGGKVKSVVEGPDGLNVEAAVAWKNNVLK